MEEGRCALKILTDTPTGKRVSGRTRRRWEGNIRMDLQEIDTKMRNPYDYWRALVNAKLNLRVP